MDQYANNEAVQNELARHVQTHKHIYDRGLMNPEKHRVIVEDLPHWGRMCGIHPDYLWNSSMKDIWTPEDKAYKYFLNYPTRSSKGQYGYAFVGRHRKLDRKLATITGALARAFIQGKVIPVDDLVNLIKDDDAPTCSCVLIPDCITTTEWKKELLTGFLRNRIMMKKQTVVVIPDFDQFEKTMGIPLADMIEDNFVIDSAEV